MDSYTQILCRFQKCKQKVPTSSLPYTKTKQGSDSGEFFSLLFWNLHKIWIKESMDITLCNLVHVAT